MKSIFVTSIAAFSLTGCAGLITPFLNNPYAGTYDGTFTTSDGKNGTASVQLTKLGNVFGTLDVTDSKVTGSLNGSVKSSLSYSGTVSFTDSASRTLSGDLLSNSGKITGTLKGSDGYTITIDITQKA